MMEQKFQVQASPSTKENNKKGRKLIPSSWGSSAAANLSVTKQLKLRTDMRNAYLREKNISNTQNMPKDCFVCSSLLRELVSFMRFYNAKIIVAYYNNYVHIDKNFDHIANTVKWLKNVTKIWIWWVTPTASLTLSFFLWQWNIASVNILFIICRGHPSSF